MRKLFAVLFLVLCPTLIFAEATKTTYNPFTSKLDYITKIDCGSSPTGVRFVDTSGCVWCATVNTSGVMTTALISCTASYILMEDGTYILQEDGTKIVAE